MNDNTTSLQELKNAAAKIITDRDWNQFHNPKNLSMDIACEASELMEKFLWLTGEESCQELTSNRQEIEHELADILFAVLSFANCSQIDLTQALKAKLKEVESKYPIEKAKGRREKYTKL